MDSLVAQQPTLTQKCAFEKVFGCRYVKSTVCRHRSVWRRADDGVKAAFESMGTDERAVWGNFVKQVEGRRKPDGTSAVESEEPDGPQEHTIMHEMHYATGLQMMTTRNMDVGGSLTQTAVHSPDYQVNDVSITGGVELGDISDVDEPVMGSLGPPPANHLISGEYRSISTKHLSLGSIHQPGGITNRRGCFSSATSNRRSRFRDQQMIPRISDAVKAVLVLYEAILSYSDRLLYTIVLIVT